MIVGCCRTSLAGSAATANGRRDIAVAITVTGWILPCNAVKYSLACWLILIQLSVFCMSGYCCLCRGHSKYHYYGIRLKPTSVLNNLPPDEEEGQDRLVIYYCYCCCIVLLLPSLKKEYYLYLCRCLCPSDGWERYEWRLTKFCTVFSRWNVKTSSLGSKSYEPFNPFLQFFTTFVRFQWNSHRPTLLLGYSPGGSSIL